MKRLTLLLILFIHSSFCMAPVASHKQFYSTDYPVGYFRDPLNIPIQLAANFGELRTNHFHMGFDIRTNQRENLEVFAAAQGYVSKIKIEQFGFGQAIYITHPNGYTTLYAHLNDFYPALNNYVKSKQYAEEKWEQEIDFKPDQFPVTKGQFIAYSGNTGGSAGPHLHFEIRNTRTGNNLNPWLFGFGLPDKVPPVIYKLYSYDRRYSTYVGKPTPIPIAGGSGKYTVNNVVVLSSPFITFAISAEDPINNTARRFGIYAASVSVDNSVRSAFTINNISYDETRYLNACIDYKTKLSGGSYIQYLSRLPGNRISIFSEILNDGTIQIADELMHNAEILVKDANGNTSTLNFKFRYDASKSKAPAYPANSIAMAPGKQNVLKTNDIEATFSAKAFYDTVPFMYRSETSGDPKVVSAVHYLHNFTVPVHDSFTVRIKPIANVDENLRDRIVMQLVSNRKIESVKGKWQNGWMEGKFRDLGIVKLIIDTIAPRIALHGWANGSNVRNKKSIAFAVTDNTGEIRSFRALLDNKWLMFSRKDNLFIHTFDNNTLPGKHQLKVTVEDVAGNVSEKEYGFMR